ncbi:patatin-like phospholipase family protein [Shinella zoogloeoides]|uniref:patatin-like phospholipase family protein n=1 Tax=Shinella zoogloeoides TaxID=352475 RepID=UPI00273D69BD|nr:patatin-like phospholipase family protein [Shinella zoogloeoides]WLR91645.1 patatin-like phospholipase family protein [Shinella zoogloeoides]
MKFSAQAETQRNFATRFLGTALAGILIFVVATLSGCVAPERPAYNASEARRAEIAGFENIRAHVDDPRPSASIHDPWKPVILKDKPTMLAISGGGAGGAFAVGILSAWSELGTRPRFEVVTGVSTGALIAPFAFLGSKYDEQLRRLYLSGETRDLLDIEWKGAGFFSPGFLKGQALRGNVEQNITPEILRRIAAEHRAGRRLLVMTTNLDTQRAVIWNIGAIADSRRPDALSLVRQVLIASASVPGILPPVSIRAVVDGKHIEELHSDGGSSAQFFTVPESLLVTQNDHARGQGLHIYVIVNNALIPEFSMSRERALPIMGRAYGILLKSQTRHGLIALYNFAQRAGVDLDIASIDEQVPYSMLDPLSVEYMRSVYRIGYEKTLDRGLWARRPVFRSSDLRLAN